jgi:hypothetical protein
VNDGIVGTSDAYDVEVSVNFLSQHINILFSAVIPQFNVGRTLACVKTCNSQDTMSAT